MLVIKNRIIGTIVFWLSWPGLWLYLRGTTRSRVLIICDQRFLVVKSWLGTGQWDLPGGGLHKSEIAVDGAIREVYEETSLKLNSHQFRQILKDRISKFGLSYKIIGFVVILENLPKVKAQRSQIRALQWINFQDAQNPALSEDVQKLVLAYKNLYHEKV